MSYSHRLLIRLIAYSTLLKSVFLRILNTCLALKSYIYNHLYTLRLNIYTSDMRFQSEFVAFKLSAESSECELNIHNVLWKPDIQSIYIL